MENIINRKKSKEVMCKSEKIRKEEIREKR